jgi:transmembrane sensor
MPFGIVPPPGQWRVSPFFESRPPVIEPEDLEVPGLAANVEEAQTLPAAIAPRRMWRRKMLAAAAAVLFAVAAGACLQMLRSGDRYSTPVGGVASIPLTDGSNITLNTSSEVRVDLTKEERHIELEAGEAFFEVAHDPTRPFTVVVGKQRVVAVGTKFSIRRNHDDAQITVTEGAVRLQDADAPLRVDGTILTSAILPAGTVAQTAQTRVLTRKRTTRELDESLSWRTGYLMFDAEPLASAIAEFNRYTTRKVVIGDPDVGALLISGKVRTSNAQALTRMLHDGFGIRAEERDGSIVLLR